MILSSDILTDLSQLVFLSIQSTSFGSMVSTLNSANNQMTTQVLEANAHVIEDTGRAAVQRGPLIYCLEQLDQPAGVELTEVALDIA
jgi:hypothetical protein